MPRMLLFTLATLLPMPLIGLGAVFGGVWVILALLYLTTLTFVLDTLIKSVSPASDAEFPAADWLSIAIAAMHFPLLAIVVWGLSHGAISGLAKAALFLSAGMYFGQVGNSNAHELIHKGAKLLHRLGMWVYISLLFGHHTSAHVLVHHRHVATEADPSSARLGETYYAFALRAWIGSFRLGYRAEKERLSRIGRPAWKNPYVTYTGGALLMICIAVLIGGAWGAIAYVALALYSTAQLLLSDYVQHYGLRRAVIEGKAEPVNARHSWNSPHWFSSAMMLNAPRHSDHHAHPSRSYTTLQLPEDGPMLPRSLPTMATLALAPTIWRRIMDPRVKRLPHA